MSSFPLFCGEDGALIESEFSRPLSTMKGERMYRRVFKDLRKAGMERELRNTREPPPVGKACRDGRLTSQIAHELTTPSMDHETLELLKSEVRPRAKGGHSRAVAFRDVRLTEMLRSMLSFSKPKKRRGAGENQRLIEDSAVMEKQMREANIRVTTAFSAEIPRSWIHQQ